MIELDLNALLFSTDVSMGTLWRVKESVWKDQLPSFYVAKEKTKMHPGVSIMQAKSASSEITVPLLHGTSGKKGPVVVKGISNEQKYDENHKCYFGKIIYPALIWLVGWVFVIAGVYLAGPELVAKLKEYLVIFKNKILNKKDDKQT